MHGLINRSLQCFLRDTYGGETWLAVAQKARLGFDNFETMLIYDDQSTLSVVRSASLCLCKPPDELLEDMGTYLVSHANMAPLQRLLRFGGECFEDFLLSLDDMDEWVRLAVPDLNLPKLAVQHDCGTEFTIRCEAQLFGVGHVLMGILRGMADAYGALALLEHLGKSQKHEVISVQLVSNSFSQAQDFRLGMGGA